MLVSARLAEYLPRGATALAFTFLQTSRRADVKCSLTETLQFTVFKLIAIKWLSERPKF